MKSINEPDNMLSNLYRVMRQLRRRPQGTKHADRGTYWLLRTIAKFPDISTRELAEKMDIRQASLNERLVRLESEGLIRRDRDSKDQRVFVVNLEQIGRDHLLVSQEIRSKMNESISKILTAEEIRDLTSLAEKLAIGLEEINEEGGKLNGK